MNNKLLKVLSGVAAFSVIFSNLSPLLALVKAEDSQYDFKVESIQIPDNLQPGQELEIPIKIENIGTSAWSKVDEYQNPFMQINYKLQNLSTKEIIEGEPTDLLNDIPPITSKPENVTHPNQKLLFKAPAEIGQYELEIYLYNNTKLEPEEKFIQSAEKQKFQINLNPPLTPDITAPQGTIIINNGEAQTDNVNIEINLSATDPNVEGQVTSGVSQFKLSTYSDFADVNWEAITGDPLSRTLAPVPSNTTYYAKFLDNAGNESETYFATVEFIASAPTGGIKIDEGDTMPNSEVDLEEVQNSNVSVTLNANSNVNVTEYKLVYSNQFSIFGSEVDQLFNQNAWITFSNPSPIVELSQEIELPDQTNAYTFFVKYRNEFGQESEVYSKSIYYKSYNIIPLISSETLDVLIGGEDEIHFTVKNTGQDIGYNTTVELTLPQGFELINTDEEVKPSYININEQGLQVLQYKAVADLLENESIKIKLKVKIGGVDEGYKLGDQIQIPVNIKMFKRTDFQTGAEVNQNLNLVFVPFKIRPQSQSGEQLVGETIQNQVTIETNSDIPAQSNEGSNNAMVVQFELDNGISYVEGSQSVLINGIPAQVVFEIIETINSNPILVWMFGEADVNSVIELFFSTEIEKIEQDGSLIPNFVEHDQSIQNDLSVTGTYANPVDPDCNNVPLSYPSNSDCIPDPVDYQVESTQEIIAKYFKVNKYVSKVNEQPFIFQRIKSGDIVTYAVEIKTSDFYDLYSIELEDMLPDGINYIGDLSSEIIIPELTQNSKSTDGTTVLTWKLDSIQSSNIYQFEYKVQVSDKYDSKDLNGDQRIFSSDPLGSTITLKGMWLDNDPANGSIRSGVAIDTDSANLSVQSVKISEGIRLAGQNDFVDSIEVKIGDEVNVRSLIQFPEKNPTFDFEYYIYLPIGTELIGNLSINSFGNFEKQPTNYQTISGGYYFDLGKIDPGSTLEITYNLRVLDDTNLRLTTQVRNLFRADYNNIEGESITHRSDLLLIILEPKLEVTKQILSGYLARGEEAQLKTTIKNSGTSTAYGVNIADEIPTNVSLKTTANLSVTSNMGNVFEAVFDSENNQYLLTNVILQSGEEISLTYSVITNENVLYGDLIESNVNLGTYSNRSETDTLPPRIFLPTNYNFKWYAKESLLSTQLRLQNYNIYELPIGRNQTFKLFAITRPVGEAPVYNNQIRIDLSSLQESDNPLTINSVQPFVNNQAIDLMPTSIQNNVYTFENINLNPGDVLKFDISITTPKFVPFDQSYSVNMSVIGQNKLGTNIFKDGSVRTNKDRDEDDSDSKVLITTKLDQVSPTGEIKFSNCIETCQYIFASNSTSVDKVEYYGWDQDSEIIGVRFTNDLSEDWYTPEEYAPLEAEAISALNLSGNWNAWEEGMFELDFLLKTEGKNYKYMQIVDLYGNTSTIENYVIKDTQAPDFARVSISPFENDLSNPELTGLLSNYVNFVASDSIELTEDISGVGEFRYTVDPNLENWSTWTMVQEGVNSFIYNFNQPEDEQNLVVFMQIRDYAGNIYTSQSSQTNPITNELLPSDIIFDTIEFTSIKPKVTLNLNEGAEFTNFDLVNLAMIISDYDIPIKNIRFGSEEFFEEWFTYPESGIQQYVLPESWNDGTKTLCVQIQNEAGAISETACDSIKLDTGKPVGSINISTDTSNDNSIPSTVDGKVNLSLLATDPALYDQTAGSGVAAYRTSLIGTDPILLSPEQESEIWNDWIMVDPSEALNQLVEFDIGDKVGRTNIYVQYRDKAGNISSIYTDEVVNNPYFGTGNIVIENNDLFTDTKYVNVDLNLENFDKSIALMRFIQIDSNNQIAPDISEIPVPISNNDPNADQNGWTYWIEYSNNIQWNLNTQLPSFMSGTEECKEQSQSERQCYGLKSIFVQYMFINGEVTGIYSDSIVYTPVYGIEYFDSLNEQPLQQTVQVPANALTQDSFTMKLRAHNFGSLTWSSQDNNPVHITYKWNRIGGGPLPYPIPVSDPSYGQVRGNFVILPKNIFWNETTDELTLKVNTPVFEGEYELIIDTVHEGGTWFSTFGNETPTFLLNISQNPDKPIPSLPEFEMPDNSGEGEWGNGPKCVYGSIWNYEGTVQKAPDPYWDEDLEMIINPYDAPYVIFINSVGYYYDPGESWDHFIGKELITTIRYTGYECNFEILAIQEKPKTWISTYLTKANPLAYNDVVRIKRGSSLTFQPVFLNQGTGLWSRGDTYLRITNMNTWTGGARKEMWSQSAAQGAAARFEFTLTVPTDATPKLNELCFQVWKDNVTWQKSDTKCIRIQVEYTEAELRQFRCAQPQSVFDLPPQPTGSTRIPKKIGEINQNDEVIILSSEVFTGIEWIRVYIDSNILNLPSGTITPEGTPVDGWVNNADDCFNFITNVPNPIEQTVLPVVPRPTGNDAYIIAVDGIDVYLGPSSIFPVIDRIAYNYPIEIIGYANVGGYFDRWVNIKYPVGCSGTECKTGWIPWGYVDYADDFVMPEIAIDITPPYKPAHVCASGKQARTGPGNIYPVITTLPFNFNTSLLYQWKDQNNMIWYQIYVNGLTGETGWIDSTGVCEGYYYPPEMYGGDYTGNIGGVGGVTFLNGLPFSRPIKDYELTGRFGDPRNGYVHDGSDYAYGEYNQNNELCVTGPFNLFPVKVYAAAEGMVEGIKVDQYRGIYIDILHPNLMRTRYLHLSPTGIQVSRGQRVKRGQYIANVGLTGNTTGCHLHFEIWTEFTNPGSKIDPESVFNTPANQIMLLIEAYEKDKFADVNGRSLFEVQCGVVFRRNNGGMLDLLVDIPFPPGAVYYSNYDRSVIHVRGSIYDEYIERGGPCGVLGEPRLTEGKSTHRPTGSNISTSGVYQDSSYTKPEEYEDLIGIVDSSLKQ